MDRRVQPAGRPAFTPENPRRRRTASNKRCSLLRRNCAAQWRISTTVNELMVVTVGNVRLTDPSSVVEPGCGCCRRYSAARRRDWVQPRACRACVPRTRCACDEALVRAGARLAGRGPCGGVARIRAGGLPRSRSCWSRGPRTSGGDVHHRRGRRLPARWRMNASESPVMSPPQSCWPPLPGCQQKRTSVGRLVQHNGSMVDRAGSR
jgi:hypothetical protein